jgi:hypothetical protein
MMAGPSAEPTAEQIAETQSVVSALEAVTPVVLALADRATRAFSSLEVMLIEAGVVDRWTQEDYDAFDERTGRGRLWRLATNMRDALSDEAMLTDEIREARKAVWGID